MLGKDLSHGAEFGRGKKGELFLTFEAGILLKTNNNNNFGIGSFHHIYENKRLILP